MSEVPGPCEADLDDRLHTWTPLFQNIIFSSVWELPLHVRVVWVALLALKNRNGFVPGAGLRRMANVSEAELEESLRIFQDPDPRSQSKEFEGRKIRQVEGGWLILNHGVYQKKMREVSQKIGNRRRQARYREKAAEKKTISMVQSAMTSSERVAKNLHDEGRHEEADRLMDIDQKLRTTANDV